MYSFNCEVCSQPSDTVTADQKHVICSVACKEKLEAPGLLTVTGRGEVTVSPDRVRIGLDIERTGATFAIVHQLLTEAANKLIDLLKSDKRAYKIQTDNLRIEPLYKKETEEETNSRERRRTEREITGYEGHFPLSFEAQIGEAGSLFTVALANNYASRITGLDYIVSDEVSQPAYIEALRLASLDAQNKAQVILDSLKLSKKAITRIDIDKNGPRRMLYSQTSFSPQLAMAEMQIIAPDEKVNASLTLVMSYK